MSRDELFTRRNPREHSYYSNGSSSVERRKEHETISMEGYMSQEQNRLLQSHREIDDMLGQGAETMGSLRNQREMLKNTRTRILDITNTLGVSQTVMRFIEKRSSTDRIILFVGMAAFTLFMILVWFYFL